VSPFISWLLPIGQIIVININVVAHVHRFLYSPHVYLDKVFVWYNNITNNSVVISIVIEG